MGSIYLCKIYKDMDFRRFVFVVVLMLDWYLKDKIFFVYFFGVRIWVEL